MTDTHTRLIEALDRIKANQDKPILRVVRSETRDLMKWRKRHNAFLKQQLEDIRCSKQSGSGERGSASPPR